MSAACPRHPWDLPTGLPCLGSGPGHTHHYEASESPDRHCDDATDGEATS